MKNQQSTVRFDHREIAVVFSLFIFVSLLMFTVGILVGKGLQQAKYEAQGGPTRSIAHGDHAEAPSLEAPHGAVAHSDSGTSIMTGHEEKETPELDKEPGHGNAHADAADLDKHSPPKSAVEEADEHHKPESGHEEHAGLTETENSIDLVPAHPKKDKFASIDSFPATKESEKLLKDPKLAKVIEEKHPARTTASLIPGMLPKSFPHGKYTVQVASYPNQREAVERVEKLKKDGFPFAYYSAKEIDGKKGVWYRVWLGYFPDTDTARQGGELLQSRGEVNSYFVRKSENEG